MTYLNRNKTPIIRKCGNCIHYETFEKNNELSGYCKALNLLFAFTHEKSVYAIVKDFYLCEKHEFFNEETLKRYSEETELLPFLQDRNATKKINK
jgi:hypothetical protein